MNCVYSLSLQDNIGKFSCKSKYIYAFHFRTHLLAEIMEATRNDEYSIFNSYACIPKNILHNATSLHASKNMLNDDSWTWYRPIEYFIGNGKRAIARFLFRLIRDDTFWFIALKSTIFFERCVFRKRVLFFVTDGLIMPDSFVCLAEMFNGSPISINNDDVIIEAV